MRLLFLFLYSCLFVQIAFSQEYIYPIAAIEDGKTILLIHQKSPMHIELWFWNPITKQVEQGLWSLFEPAGLQLLPDLSGFSFVDKGRLHIKYFNKRAPKAIDLYEPLWSINLVHWVNSHFCYLSAQQGDFFSVYFIDVDGAINCLISQTDKDCLYPQKIDDFLFYIERSKIITNEAMINNYRIIKTDFCSSHSIECYSEALLQDEKSCIQNIKMPELIMEYHDSPIIFLHMLSKEEGFVIEHPTIINSRDAAVLFHYHRIVLENMVWYRENIFSFAIPSSLLLHESSDQLYESLLPLLPKKIDNIIYFVDCLDNDKNSLELFSYDIATQKKIKKCTANEQDQHFFTPFFMEGKIFVGGTVNEVSTRLWIDEKLGICVDLINF